MCSALLAPFLTFKVHHPANYAHREHFNLVMEMEIVLSVHPGNSSQNMELSKSTGAHHVVSASIKREWEYLLRQIAHFVIQANFSLSLQLQIVPSASLVPIKQD